MLVQIIKNYLRPVIILAIFATGLTNCNGNEGKKTDTSPKLQSGAEADSLYYRLFSSVSCPHKELSKQFDIAVSMKKYKAKSGHNDSGVLQLHISDKKTGHLLDSISLSSLYYFDAVMTDCDAVRSYSTNYDTNEEIADGQFGNVVVADLNFDGKDDIAVVNDSGGNGGTLYSFYMQDKQNKFTPDQFLTDTVQYFPNKIDKARHQLKTLTRAGMYGVNERVFQKLSVTAVWKQTSYRLITGDDK